MLLVGCVKQNTKHKHILGPCHVKVTIAAYFFLLLVECRASDDVIEQEGVRRAVSRSHEADLLIIMLSCEDLGGSIDGLRAGVKEKVIELLTQHVQVTWVRD